MEVNKNQQPSERTQMSTTERLVTSSECALGPAVKDVLCAAFTKHLMNVKELLKKKKKKQHFEFSDSDYIKGLWE